MEEEVSGCEFQGYEAGYGDVRGNLLDEFGGKGREVRCFEVVEVLISLVRHCGGVLFGSFLMRMILMLQRQ